MVNSFYQSLVELLHRVLLFQLITISSTENTPMIQEFCKLTFECNNMKCRVYGILKLLWSRCINSISQASIFATALISTARISDC